ncbi:MAG: DsrE family protein [Promethearchaeota archaeon]
MFSIIFLYAEKIPVERHQWILNSIEFCLLHASNEIKINFYLTGDSLYSLIDKRYIKLWKKILKFNHVALMLDSWDAELLGIKNLKLEQEFSNKINYVKLQEKTTPIDFWDHFIGSISVRDYENKLGFLEMRGPYISRTSVHAIRFLKSAVKNNVSAELYAYIDGVHLGHDCQKPSEFENIGEELKLINELAKKKNLESNILACSRCGTARGYIKEDDLEIFHQSDDSIPSFLFCNLNRIIDRYELNHIIISPTSSIIKREEKSDESQKPPILIFITHSPYGSEWTFGGISFAIACANHEILTDVVFIEDGALICSGEHDVKEEDKIFNVQDIIEATSDIEDLKYYVFKPSLELRGIQSSNEIEGLKLITHQDLIELTFSNQIDFHHKRVIFF